MIWHPLKIPPKPDVPIIMRGPSGYMPPHDWAYQSGYYSPDYRPRQPWLTHAGDSITDYGDMPTSWAYRSEFDGMF